MKNFHFKNLLLVCGVLFLIGAGCTKTTPATSNTSMTESTQSSVSITAEELAKHNIPSDCWIKIDGQIYDLTKFVGQHPKSQDPVIKNCGKDGSAIFELKHSPDKKQQLQQYLIK